MLGKLPLGELPYDVRINLAKLFDVGQKVPKTVGHVNVINQIDITITNF